MRGHESKEIYEINKLFNDRRPVDYLQMLKNRGSVKFSQWKGQAFKTGTN